MPAATSAAAPRWHSGVAWALAAAGLYAGLMALLYPYRGVFAFDPDEGNNAMHALLLERGAALYTEIWSNQPPLFTHALRLWLAAFGWEVDAGRMMVLLFAAACVFALYDVVRLIAGHGAAAIACLLLASGAYFPRLSVSLMQAVPSLALAMLALWALVRWQFSGHRAWIAAAGVLMGCALASKLSTAVVLPAFAAWLVAVGPHRPGGGRCWRPAFDWLLGTLITAAVLLLWWVGPAQLSALVDTHRAARLEPGLSRFGWRGLVLTAFAEWPLTLLGLGGYVLVLYWRLRLAMVFPLWAAVALIATINHVPIWYHHQLPISVPHCAAGGIAVAELFRRGADAARLPMRLLLAMRVAALGLVAALPLWSAFGAPVPEPTPLSGTPQRVLNAMRELAPTTHVVVVSDTMYAFRAGYSVPPALATLPLLRVLTDPRLGDDVRAAFAQRLPDQVLLVSGTAPELDATVRAAMADRYRLLLDEAGTQLFVRDDVRRPGD